ncbi:MAG: hypothetical protein FJW32_08255 [Acidobacteria bacterium]|nr:hypothetical protein [Acidobacteriota bacterium]
MRLFLFAVTALAAFGQFSTLTLSTYDMFRYATAAQRFSYRFTPTGGLPPYRFTVQEETTLAPGLSLNAATGELSGIIPQVGEHRQFICVSDSTRAQTCVPFLVIAVGREGETYTELLPARVNTEYNNLISQPGEFTEVAYDAASGRFPTGLILEITGRLYGIPQAPGGAWAFRVRGRNFEGEQVTRNYVIRVQGPLIASAVLPNAFNGIPYSATPAIFGDAPPHLWSVRRGPIPPGFTLDEATGRITGTSTVSGSFPFTLRAVDKFGGAQDREMTITVENTPAPIEIRTDSLPGASIGVPYRQQINVQGGRMPYSYRFLGSLPPGVTLSSTGEVAGTPTTAGSFLFTVQVIDLTGLSASKTFTIAVGSLRYTGPATVSVFAQEAARVVLSVEGGTAPFRWSVIAGTLPTGIALSEDGILSGTPAAASQTTATVRLTDASARTVEFPLTITVGAARPVISRNGVVNGASFAAGSIAPGQIVTIFGERMGPATIAPFLLDNNRRIPTALAGTRVLFGGIAAPLLYVSATQIGAIVPYDIGSRTTVDVVVDASGVRSAANDYVVAPAAPGLFTGNATGRGQAAALNQDGSLNGAANPARAGSVVVLFATGEGRTVPANIDGSLQGNDPGRPVLPVRVTVGGREADVVYAGGSPGLVSGLLQANIRLALDTAAGDQAVVLRVGDTPSSNTATISIIR